MKPFDKLLRWDELRTQLKAAEEAGIDLAKENADLHVENALLRCEIERLRGVRRRDIHARGMRDD